MSQNILTACMNSESLYDDLASYSNNWFQTSATQDYLLLIDFGLNIDSLKGETGSQISNFISVVRIKSQSHSLKVIENLLPVRQSLKLTSLKLAISHCGELWLTHQLT